MDDNTLRLIRKIKFFDNKEINNIEKISSNKLKIEIGSKNYTLGLYPLDFYKDLDIEQKLEKYLDEAGVDVLKVYDLGILPDINKSYKVFDYRKEMSLKEFLELADKNEAYKKGHELGKILNKFHNIYIDDKQIDWYKEFNTKVNYVMYMHGLIDKKGDKDYMLIDFINSNKHIAKNTAINLIHSNLDLKNIRISEEGIDLRGLKELKKGDGVIDFVLANEIAIDNPSFSYGMIMGYNNGNMPSRKFFKLLSLYQSYYLLESIVNNKYNKNARISTENIDKIYEMYDGFTRIIPLRAEY